MLREEDARVLAVARGLEPDAPVPSCPDWTAGDLLWHLVEVQWLWGSIVAQRRTTAPDDELDADRPPRPPAIAGLVELLATTSRRLEDALERTDPATPLWSWSSNGGDAAWVRRRQAHEVLVHRFDAELAAGLPIGPTTPAIAHDGIDELVSEFLTGVPAWGRFTPSGRSVVVRTTDTGGSWGLSFGRMTGTSPRSGRDWDLPAAMPTDERSAGADAVVSGPSATLHSWLWGRAGGDGIDVDGDGTVFDELRALVADSTG